MDFRLSDEQLLLQEAAARFARESVPAEGEWARLAALGWLGLAVPEEAGGAGCGAVEAMLVAEALGRAMSPAPWLPTALLGAGLLAAAAGAAQRRLLLPRLAAGELRLAVPLDALAHPTAEARRDGRGYRLSARHALVPGADSAEALLIPARLEGGDALFLVPRAALRLVPQPLMDGRGAADLAAEEVGLGPEARLDERGVPPGSLALVADRAAAALCADALGAMREALALTREHLRTREQFGGKLARFQVLRHRFVDMHLETEAAAGMAMVAAMACESRDAARRARLVAAARLRVGRAARMVGEAAIQLHGGIGMTEEHRVGRLYKRILVDDALLGRRAASLERLLAHSQPEHAA